MLLQSAPSEHVASNLSVELCEQPRYRMIDSLRFLYIAMAMKRLHYPCAQLYERTWRIHGLPRDTANSVRYQRISHVWYPSGPPWTREPPTFKHLVLSVVTACFYRLSYICWGGNLSRSRNPAGTEPAVTFGFTESSCKTATDAA